MRCREVDNERASDRAERKASRPRMRQTGDVVPHALSSPAASHSSPFARTNVVDVLTLSRVAPVGPHALRSYAYTRETGGEEAQRLKHHHQRSSSPSLPDAARSAHCGPPFPVRLFSPRTESAQPRQSSSLPLPLLLSAPPSSPSSWAALVWPSAQPSTA